MTDFTPADIEGLTGDDLVRALIHEGRATHACVDGLRKEHSAFVAKQEAFNEDASQKRHAMANGQMELQGALRSVGRRVSRLASTVKDEKARRRSTDDQLSLLLKMFGAKAWEPGEARVKPTVPRTPFLKQLVSGILGVCVIVGALALGIGAAVDLPGTVKLMAKVAAAFLATKP